MTTINKTILFFIGNEAKGKIGLSDDWVLAIGMFSFTGSILLGRFTVFE